MLRAARRGARGIANRKCPSKAALESETIIWSQDLAGSGVTVNALSPGGATRTGMVPSAGLATPGLLDPDIIVPPLLWLASERSNGVTGMRFVATRWRSDVDETEAAEGSRERAGWPSDPPLL
jgi:NAD(P)-dependent dehydrogenase (short-subunit alcohol dehydrogenase family)